MVTGELERYLRRQCCPPLLAVWSLPMAPDNWLRQFFVPSPPAWLQAREADQLRGPWTLVESFPRKRYVRLQGV